MLGWIFIAIALSGMVASATAPTSTDNSKQSTAPSKIPREPGLL